MKSLKFLFLVNRDIDDPLAAGGEIHLYTIANILSQRGHKVTYVCRSYPQADDKEQIGNLKISRLKPFMFSLRVLCYYLRNVRNRFDVIVEQVFGGYRLPFMCALYTREPLVAIWYQRHTKIYHTQYCWPLAALLSTLERGIALFYKRTTIVTDSTDQKAEISQLGLSPERILVIPPGPYFLKQDVEARSCVEPKPRSFSEPMLLTLGKLRKYKCYHHVIFAVKTLLHNHPSLRLVVAGKREDLRYEDSLREIIRSHDLQDNVEIKLNINEEEKTRLLEEAYLLVLPSPVEGFGMVALEANLVGTPVIASDGVPHDAVQDNYNGLRYPFGDIDGMAKTIDRLLDDTSLWKKFSGNAVEHVKKFTWVRIVDKFEKIAYEIWKKKCS